MKLTREKMYLLASRQINDGADCLSAGYSLADCRSAGYSLAACRSAGYSAADCLSAGYSLAACRSAGYSAADCLSAGYSLADCRSAGYSLADCRSAGYSLADCLSAGYSLAACRSAGYSAAELTKLEDETPKVEKPYSTLLADIRAKKRKHNQSTFGPESDPKTNLCGSQMCTASHLVNLAGEAGYKLKEKFGWETAAALIHKKAHPGEPAQNFGSIPQEWAIAYIETMAAKEGMEL